MGRRNKNYHKDLEQQANEKLKSMVHIGESKRDYVLNKGNTLDENGDETDGRIFSIQTYKNYWANTKHFLAYMKEYHPDIGILEDARAFVPEYLEKAEYDDKSAWTIQLYAKALNKLFGITPQSDDYVVPPERRRKDITRSRGTAVRDKYLSPKTNEKLIRFCKGTGLRRSELKSLKKEALFTKDQIEDKISELKGKENKSTGDYLELDALKDTRRFKENYYLYVKGKGGRIRYSPVLEKFQDTVLEKFDETPHGKKVWFNVNGNADIHSYRSDYANMIYKLYARDIEDIPKKEQNPDGSYSRGIYYTRGDEIGGAYDRRAMELCSKALGHNRVTVVAENYLRGI